MKITICGSLSFAKEMRDIQEKLERDGHQCLMPDFLDDYVSEKASGQDIQRKIEKDLIKRHYNLIKSSDVILILNYKKKDTDGYVGGNSFLEMAFAHVLNKKIFLLNPIPEMGYTDEIKAMQPVVVNGNLELIK